MHKNDPHHFHFQLHDHQDAPAKSKAQLCEAPFNPQLQSTSIQGELGSIGGFQSHSGFDEVEMRLLLQNLGLAPKLN